MYNVNGDNNTMALPQTYRRPSSVLDASVRPAASKGQLNRDTTKTYDGRVVQGKFQRSLNSDLYQEGLPNDNGYRKVMFEGKAYYVNKGVVG